MTLVYTLAVVSVGVLLWLADGVRRIGAVSTGAPIGARTGTALLLIDLQDIFWEDGPYGEAATSAAERAIRSEIAAARERGDPVIALRQEWSIPSTRILARLTMKGQAIAGTPGTQLAKPFVGLADHEVVKRVQDAFETGALDDLLATLDVGRLRLVGLDFNHCVQKTALAARNRGYEVTIVKPATLSVAPTQNAANRLSARAVVLQEG
ncbi:MAG: cysteine hydrolase [Maritimibacter sp.]|nr:cysteine hydrolase [Maritimibacter sp.]